MSSASTPCLASSSIIHHPFFFPKTSRPLPLPLGRSTTQPYLYRVHTFTSKAVPLWATQDDFRGKERERERGGGHKPHNSHIEPVTTMEQPRPTQFREYCLTRLLRDGLVLAGVPATLLINTCCVWYRILEMYTYMYIILYTSFERHRIFFPRQIQPKLINGQPFRQVYDRPLFISRHRYNYIQT